MENPLDNTNPSSTTPNEAVGVMGMVYNNLALRGTTNLSKGLGKIFELTSSLKDSWLSKDSTNIKKETFQNNLSALKEKIDEIPEEKVCEVPPEIGVPIMDKLTYVTNKQIRDAYINLLSKSASEDTANLAHPAFESLIGRLSADEARILDYLKGREEVVFLNYKINTEKSGYYMKKKFATGIEYDVALDFPSNIDVYIINLLNMGILSYIPGIHKMSEDIYKPLLTKYKPFEEQLTKEIEQRNHFLTLPLPEEVINKIERFTNYEHEKGYFDITPFGKLFITACTSSNT